MGKIRVTFYIDEETMERVRDAAWWTPGLTLSGLAERALLQSVEGLEEERGETFPPRNSESVKGRPVR